MSSFWHVLHVYFSITSSMLWSYDTTSTEFRVALERHDASTLLEHLHHYQHYIQENLPEQVPTDPAMVSLLTSCPFYFLCVIIDCPSQFKDVSSPVADEVMEERADIEKIGTERTDHKRVHASHAQHTMPA